MSRKHPGGGRWLWGITVLVAVWMCGLRAAWQTSIPQGSEAKARKYYQDMAATLRFATPNVLESTLDDVPRYLGYEGLSARDLQQLASTVLMDPARLGKPCEGGQPCDGQVQDASAFQKNFAARPMQPGEVLASRFLAPKIANVSEGASTRAMGWRKLVRLRARTASQARANGISDGIILFNYFTKPGQKPFEPDDESANTQVMLLSTRTAFRDPERDSLYWLDYDKLSAGGKISFKLPAAFDAGDLQGASGAIKDYFVPDGCVACHGENQRRPMVNYLDTDHWFDRIEDDFRRVRDEGLPVLFDGGAATTTLEFAKAFDVIRRFNRETEAHAAFAQPGSFHRAAGRNWLRLHETSSAHFPPAERAVQGSARWSSQSDIDVELIGMLNRFCFRCHGTILFNVFDKAHILQRKPLIPEMLRPSAEQVKANQAMQMPPDRKLTDAEIERLQQLLFTMGAR